MRKFILISLLWVSGLTALNAQTDLTFYHLGASTPQSSIRNASFTPNAKFYISLPALSGVKLKFDGGFSYSNLMRPIEGTDSVKVDIDMLLNHLESGDRFTTSGTISIFQMGYSKGSWAVNLFSNSRYSMDFVYPVNFLTYFVNGNGGYLGERIEETDLNVGGMVYNEIGVGFAKDFLVMQDKKLRIGVRAKYLQGIAHLGSSENASITMYTDPDTYDLSIKFQDATFKTAGLNELTGGNPVGYVLANDNKGFAVDLGAEFAINDRFSTLLAVNDIGSISWKQGIENHSLIEDEIIFSGFEDLDEIDIAQAFEDSLDVWTESETSYQSYKTGIGTTAIISGVYHLPKGRFIGSISNTKKHNGKSDMAFGIGYTHQFGKILTLSSTISKEQRSQVNVGGGLAARFGFFQLYTSFNDAVNVGRDIREVSDVDVRFGINFLFGRLSQGTLKIKEEKTKSERIKREKKQKVELSPFPPEYNLDHLEGDGDN
jgi:hypothetical protein